MNGGGQVPFGANGSGEFTGNIRWVSKLQGSLNGVVSDLCPADGWGTRVTVRVQKTKDRFSFFYDGNGCDNGNEPVKVIIPKGGGTRRFVSVQVCEVRDEGGLSLRARECVQKSFYKKRL